MKRINRIALSIACLCITALTAYAEYTEPAARSNVLGVMGEIYDQRDYKNKEFNAHNKTGFIRFTTYTKDHYYIDWRVYGVTKSKKMILVDEGLVNFQNVSLPKLEHNEVFEYGRQLEDPNDPFETYVFSMQVSIDHPYNPGDDENMTFWEWINSMHESFIDYIGEGLYGEEYIPVKERTLDNPKYAERQAAKEAKKQAKEESSNDNKSDNSSKQANNKEKSDKDSKDDSKSSGLSLNDKQVEYAKKIKEFAEIVAYIQGQADRVETMEDANKFESKNKAQLNRAETLIKELKKGYDSGDMNVENRKRLDGVFKQYHLTWEDMEDIR